MSKIGTKVVEGGDDVQTGVEYQIITAEEVTTEVAYYKGIRVGLEDKKGNLASVMLWQRPVTSPGSKLGAFITLLGDDTEKWLGKKIIFKAWAKDARKLEVA